MLSVVSDKPIPHDNSGAVDYFLADIRQATDYSPFGVTLSGRNFTLAGAEKSRNGYQGSEKDDEMKGEGNNYDFGARLLDPRLGRWLTIDPQSKKQPDQSPYKAIYNNPLYWADPDSETEFETIIVVDKQSGKTFKISVGKSDKIITDGFSYRENLFGTKSYNYYDYSKVTKYTIAADGKVTVNTYKEILYYRGIRKETLGYGGKYIDPSDLFLQRGGFYMTGGSGDKSDETKYHAKNPKYVGNIDKLLSIPCKISKKVKN